jgi:hypothetical protein
MFVPVDVRRDRRCEDLLPRSVTRTFVTKLGDPRRAG